MKGLRLAMIGFVLVNTMACSAPRDISRWQQSPVTPQVIIVDDPKPEDPNGQRDRERRIDTAITISKMVVVAGGIAIEVLRVIR